MLVRSVTTIRSLAASPVGRPLINRKTARHRLIPTPVRRLTTLHAKKAKTSTPVETVSEDPAAEEMEEVVTSERQVEEEVVEEEYLKTYVSEPPQFPVAPPHYIEKPSTGLPPWVWIAVGVLLAAAFNKVMNFISRPQEAMTEMMMKQMMSQMNAAGNTAANPFAGMPPTSPPPTGFPNPTSTKPPPGFPNPTSTKPPPAYDVKATTPPPAAKTVDPQANGVKTEPAPSPGAGSFFQDVGSTKQESKKEEVENPDEMVDYMFEMLRNPQMRESLYQFLPENMRNPEMLETVMSSPMVREQFKTMMTPEMMEQVKGFRGQMDDPQMRSQLESMNVSPDILMQKLMNEPELVAMLQKPNVMQAVMEMQKDPASMSKYMNDPEVMEFTMKMNELTLQAQMQSQNKTETTPPTN